MMRIMKILLALAVIVVLLVVIAGILLVTVVDPNRFKGQISHLVESKTGRQLVIKGEIERSVFPWLGVRVHDVTLGNSAAFATRGDFLSVGEVDIKVQLLPLLHKQVEVDKLTLTDVTLNLIKNSAGQTNWQDLTSHHQTTAATAAAVDPAPATPKAEVAAPLAIIVAGVDISRANINYADEQNDQSIQIKNLNLKTKGVAAGETFPVSLSFALSSNKPKLAGDFALDANVTPNIKQAIYQLDKIRFKSTLAGWQAPLQLMADQVLLNLNQQTLSVSNIMLASGDLNLKGNIQGQNISTNPSFQGHVQAASFNLKTVLNALGKKITTRDPQALQRVAVTADFQATKTSLSINLINLTIDDSTLQGNVNVQDFATQTAKFHIVVNQVNLDRYIPESEAAQQMQATGASSAATHIAGTPATVATAAAPQNSQALQRANINGDVSIGSLTLSKNPMSNVYAQIAIKNGVVQVAPLTAGVFQGNSSSQVKIDLRSAMPLYDIDETLTNVQLNQMTRSNRLTGTANINAHLTMRGTGKEAMLRSLNGTTKFEIKNGIFTGVNIPYAINLAWSKIGRQPAPAAPASNTTEFGAFTGTGTFRNGVFSNNDLLVQSSQFKMTGHGTANLVSQQLDYHIQAVGLQAATDEQGNISQQERQTPIPLLVTGSFSKPLITPDPAAIANLLLKQKVDQLKQRIEASPTVAPIRERARELLLQRLGQ